MTANQTGEPRPWHAFRQYGTLDELEAAAGWGPQPRPMTQAGRVTAIKTGSALFVLPAPLPRIPASAFVPSTDVTDEAAMAEVRAYIAAAHVEYAEYAAERDAAREHRAR